MQRALIRGARLIRAGLVAEFRLDAGAGTGLVDSSGLGKVAFLGADATAEATDPAWGTTGLTFDGSNDYCNLGAVSGWPMTTEATSFTFVVVASRAADGANHQLFQARKIAASNQGHDFFLTSGNRLQTRISGDDGTQTAFTTTMSITGTAWRMLAMSYDGATKVPRVVCESAAQVARESGSAYAKTFTSPVGNLDLGAYGSWSSANRFSGSMGHVLVYNRALSDGELSKVYQYLRRVMWRRGVSL